MSKQQIFSFSLDQDADNTLIGFLIARKNRSSYIRRALRFFQKKKQLEEEFDHLYDSYVIAYTRLMKEMGIEEYMVPEKHQFRK